MSPVPAHAGSPSAWGPLRHQPRQTPGEPFLECPTIELLTAGNPSSRPSRHGRAPLPPPSPAGEGSLPPARAATARIARGGHFGGRALPKYQYRIDVHIVIDLAHPTCQVVRSATDAHGQTGTRRSWPGSCGKGRAFRRDEGGDTSPGTTIPGVAPGDLRTSTSCALVHLWTRSRVGFRCRLTRRDVVRCQRTMSPPEWQRRGGLGRTSLRRCGLPTGQGKGLAQARLGAVSQIVMPAGMWDALSRCGDFLGLECCGSA